MVFLKPLEKVEFSDIEKLKSDKICESLILDYKEQLLEDDKLLKQVSSFANAQGGFLIFGIRETGKGGYPEEILGIDKDQINKERMEQIILSNIQPRLNVKIDLIDHKDTSKAIVVVQIPNSYLKPHMYSRDNRFYRRYQFEALPMAEMEISDTYRRRFTTYQEVESYIMKLLKTGTMTSSLTGQTVLIPTIPSHMIDTSNEKEFAWMNSLDLKQKHDPLPTHPIPSPEGVKCQSGEESTDSFKKMEIHRNGCVRYAACFGTMNEGKMIFLDMDFCVKLLQVLQFASTLYQGHNYFGDLRIICSLQPTMKSLLGSSLSFIPERRHACKVDEISISREYSTNVVESRYEWISSGIMDEVFNSYGLWKCPFFDDHGNLLKKASES